MTLRSYPRAEIMVARLDKLRGALTPEWQSTSELKEKTGLPIYSVHQLTRSLAHLGEAEEGTTMRERDSRIYSRWRRKQ